MDVRDARPWLGARAPLFDRLVDENRLRKTEERPVRLLGRDGLIASVERELALLLNTRSVRSLDQLDEGPLTVIDYGLPDYSAWYTESLTDRGRLEEVVRTVVEAFEPRLANPTVRVVPSVTDRKTLLVDIGGDLRIGTHMEPVSFPLEITGKVPQPEDAAAFEGGQDA